MRPGHKVESSVGLFYVCLDESIKRKQSYRMWVVIYCAPPPPHLIVYNYLIGKLSDS